MRTANTLIIATANRHKVEEFKELFRPWPSIRIAAAVEFIRRSNLRRDTAKMPWPKPGLATTGATTPRSETIRDSKSMPSKVAPEPDHTATPFRRQAKPRIRAISKNFSKR